MAVMHQKQTETIHLFQASNRLTQSMFYHYQYFTSYTYYQSSYIRLRFLSCFSCSSSSVSLDLRWRTVTELGNPGSFISLMFSWIWWGVYPIICSHWDSIVLITSAQGPSCLVPISEATLKATQGYEENSSVDQILLWDRASATNLPKL